MIFRSSQIKLTKQCIAKAYFKYHLGLQKKSTTGKLNPDLFFGLAVHKAVELLLSEGEEKAIEHLELLQFPPGPKTKNIAKILLNLFRMNFKDKMVSVEDYWTVVVSDTITLKGRFDLIGEDYSGAFVGEIKTTMPYFLLEKPNDQFISYYIAGKKMFGVDKVVLYNLDPTSVEYKKFLITYSKKETENWIEEMSRWLDFYRECVEKNILIRSEGNCLDFRRRCSYHKICTATPEVRQALIDAEFEVNEEAKNLSW